MMVETITPTANSVMLMVELFGSNKVCLWRENPPFLLEISCTVMAAPRSQIYCVPVVLIVNVCY